MIPNPVFTGGRTRAIAERAHRLIPHSRLVMIEGAGHTVQYDAPTAFNRAVEEFLP
jgi:pimeloyl-ACP methyl ester carboxylesterase